MTRQKSDERVVPKGRRKAGRSRGVERREKGKAFTVEQRHGQLTLRLGTTEKATAKVGALVGEADRGVPRPATRAGSKPRSTKGRAKSATMEAVVQRLPMAFEKVASNKGAPGPDRQSIAMVREHWNELLPKLALALLDGSYQPGEIRRVWIPKAGGEQRGLGIPNVVDRVVQEALREVLEPLYEPTFHEESHGFRPGKSCHTAIAAARRHVEEGNEWVVDIDLKKFFDRVHHQRLMARLAQRVSDRRVLAVILRMLKAKTVMPDGVVVSTAEGLPQGGPLSPLLSNIVLDELDRELHQRGHHFVRYADDCNIYVCSERAGQRVMVSVVKFIERRLRLEVNETKSAVARPEQRHFLGFRLRREPKSGAAGVGLSERSRERIDARIRELTPRWWGQSLKACVHRLNEYLRGWIAYFGICTEASALRELDGHIRRRLRVIQLRHWKRRSTMAKRLIALGAPRPVTLGSIYKGRKSLWALSNMPAMHRGLRNAYFADRGLASLQALWQEHPARVVAPEQLTLHLG